MDRKLHTAARRLGVKGELLFEAERRKQLLANAVLIRLRAELKEHPEADEITFPLLGNAAGKLERFVLSHYPQDISDRMPTKRVVSLEIDESVEPPRLNVSIGSLKKPHEAGK